jgi:hypothetical protein
MIASKRMNRCVGGGADREDGTDRMWDRRSASLGRAFDRLDPLESERAGQSRRMAAPNQILQAINFSEEARQPARSNFCDARSSLARTGNGSRQR